MNENDAKVNSLLIPATKLDLTMTFCNFSSNIFILMIPYYGKILIAGLFLLNAGFAFAQPDSTVNKKDHNGLKQGYWVITGYMVKKPMYRLDQKVEEGNYVDGKKNGVWISYYPNGNIKSKIEYKTNRPHGIYSTYYENGCIEEEGTWKNWSNVGLIKRYSSNIDSCNILIYEKNIVQNNNKTRERQSDTLKNKNSDSNEKKLPPYPYGDKLYDDQKKLIMDGEFRDGKLYNGRLYKYDKHGLLDKIEIYKEGKYVSDGKID